MCPGRGLPFCKVSSKLSSAKPDTQKTLNVDDNFLPVGVAFSEDYRGALHAYGVISHLQG